MTDLLRLRANYLAAMAELVYCECPDRGSLCNKIHAYVEGLEQAMDTAAAVIMQNRIDATAEKLKSELDYLKDK